MTKELDYLQRLRARVREEGKVIRLDDGALGVFDPELVGIVNRQNYADLDMPATLAESFGAFTPKRQVKWKDVRQKLVQQSRALSAPEHAASLEQRLRTAIEDLGRAPGDLTWMAGRIFFRATITSILSEASGHGRQPIEAEQHLRLSELLPKPERTDRFYEPFRKAIISANVGAFVKRSIRQRLNRRRGDAQDFLSIIAPMTEAWGLDRSAYVATTLLTAIAAAPGFVAACLLYELVSRPEMREAIAAELRCLTAADLARDGAACAPHTHQFIAEVFRMWSFPIAARREVRTQIEVQGHVLRPGELYLLSSYIMHRDPDVWADADRFDPSRWLSAPSNLPAYAFGWAPRSCIGASIGLLQLMLFARLVTVEYELDLKDPQAAEIVLAGFAAPRNFIGSFRPVP